MGNTVVVTVKQPTKPRYTAGKLPLPQPRFITASMYRQLLAIEQSGHAGVDLTGRSEKQLSRLIQRGWIAFAIETRRAVIADLGSVVLRRHEQHDREEARRIAQRRWNEQQRGKRRHYTEEQRLRKNERERERQRLRKRLFRMNNKEKLRQQWHERMARIKNDAALLAAHKERQRKRNKKRWSKQEYREMVKASIQKWMAAHPDYTKKYYEENKERFRELYRNWVGRKRVAHFALQIAGISAGGVG